MAEERVIIGIASIPEREDSLKDTCESLYKQADEIHIFLNGYGKDYKLSFIGRKKKYTVYHSEDFKDIGDAGKFFHAEKAAGYFLTCDDDLIYPSDYVEKMIEAVERYDRKAIVSCHGRKFKPVQVKSFYKDTDCLAHCLNEVKEDVKVHFGGTGVMAFHTDLMTVDWQSFTHRNMADVFIGVSAQNTKTPIIAIAHDKGWIKHSEKVNLKKTIYETNRNNDTVQTNLVKTIRYWNLF